MNVESISFILDKVDKWIEAYPRNVEAWKEKGNILYNALDDCEGAIECYGKATELDPKNIDAWIRKGKIFDKLKQHNDSIICYEKVLALNPAHNIVLSLKGNSLFKLERYEEAIENYNKALKISPDDEQTWCDKGFILYILGSYEEAIECYDKAININKKSEMAWEYKGLSLYGLCNLDNLYNSKYVREAIECYNKVIVLNPYANSVLVSKSNILYEQKKYKEALECLDKVKTDDEYLQAIILSLYSSILIDLNRKEEAMKYFNKLIAIDQGYPEAWISIGKIYYKMGMMKEAVNSFIRSGKDILNILVNVDEKDRDAISLCLKPLLEYDPFFKEVTKAVTNNLNIYKEVYILSMLIISRLRVSEERLVSHYTKKEITRLMLIEGSKFRLNAIDNSNDAKEGITLIDCLFDEKQRKDVIQEEKPVNYTVFAGCFTFNYDSLNQFRLYGKENGKECTGVSLVFQNSFFHKESKNFVMSFVNKYSGTSKQQTEEEKKHSLFRCIYLDPVTGFVNSVGYKEEYLFYREQEKKYFMGEIEEYKLYINKTVEYIRIKMKELKGKTNGLSPVIISKLLLHLRYLTKHISFKEEQECRIIEILRSDDNNIRKAYSKMHINYLGIKSHVKKIYFGPMVKNTEAFWNKLRKGGLSIVCVKSEHPYALQ